MQTLSSYSTINCLGYSIFNDSLEKLSTQKKLVINTINQYSYCIAEKDEDFKKSLQASDVLLPDGVGIVIAANLLENEKIKKISGADLHQFLLEHLNKNNGSCFYMGSSESTLKKIKEKIAKEYENIRVGTHSPPYKKNFTDQENEEIINKINSFAPDVVFVGMTAPKQEKWSSLFQEKLNTKTICSIGAVFDFYAGTVKRPGKIWQKFGLEWLGRLLKEPRRMYKRYIYYGFVFLFDLIQKKYAKQ